MDARGVIMLFLSIFWGGGGQMGEESRREEGVTVSCGRCKQVKKVYRQEQVPAYTRGLLYLQETRNGGYVNEIFCQSKEYCKVRCRFYLGNFNLFENLIQRKDTQYFDI